MFSRRRLSALVWLIAGAAGVLLATVSGCALFQTGEWSSPVPEGKDLSSLLTPVEKLTPHAIRIKYQIIERPVDDPLIGNLLWDGLVEMGIVDHDIRQALNDCGIRVGVASNPVPKALAKLQGKLSNIEDPSVPPSARRRSGQTITLPEGGHVEVQPGRVLAEYTATIPVKEGTEERTFHSVRGTLVVTAQSHQDGWATIKFSPEIRYGEIQNRPVVGEAGWTRWETGQSVHKLPKCDFTLTLLEGDHAVITALGEPDHRIGDLYFRDTVDGVEVQRMVVVTLVETDILPTSGQ